ncbi:histidine phosphatase family protein [Candidatus Dependentiae bacterium]
MIYLVRHAKSLYNPDIPEQERILSSEGKKQAKDLIKKLEPLNIEKIYSSPAKRAIDTIAPFAKDGPARRSRRRRRVGLEIELIPEFRECTMQPCKSFEEWKRFVKKSWEDFNFKPEGWESSLECQIRVCKKIEELGIKDLQKNIVINSHGRVISLFLNKINNSWGFDQWEKLPMPAIVKVCLKTGAICEL